MEPEKLLDSLGFVASHPGGNFPRGIGFLDGVSSGVYYFIFIKVAYYIKWFFLESNIQI